MRAYATNSAGTAYGNEVSFTTIPITAVVPTLTTTAATAITQTTATSGGNITSNGGATVTVSGVCWSTTANPVASGSHTIDGTPTGTFTSSITGLTASTTYYVRAYATNSAGTGYGNEVSFTASSVTPILPTLTTSPVTAISQTTAISGGIITSDGGATVTVSGVCWSTTANPVASGSHTTDGAAIGTYTSSITGLTANTKYYVRAYATNSIGTAYGDELTFTTNDVISTVPGAPTGVTALAGDAQATVTFTAPASDGGSTITGYIATSNPSGFIGSGTASPITVTGLTNGTAYTFTIVSTNAIGTSTASSASNSVTPSTVPGAPTGVTASAGDAQATVTFTAPISDGGSAITGYTVIASPGGNPGTGSASPITVIGLTNGTAYTFTVVATNANGPSTASSASNSVTPIAEVTNPTTGKIWMDRNLGASQVATSSTDAASYGDLYQWGRAADGHQIRTSDTTSILSGTDTPGHANFILAPSSPYDWRSPQNTNLWQGVTGINNPCPTGFRIPTDTELDAERASWSSQTAAGAYATPLKLPVAGYRFNNSGSLNFVGSVGGYWSSTVAGTSSRSLSFGSGSAYVVTYYRAFGFSVRCIKD